MNIVPVVPPACFCWLTLAAAQQICQPTANDSGKKAPADLRTWYSDASSKTATYVITGGAPGPKQFRIIGGDTSMLKGKIGHTMRVVGLVSTNDPVENTITPPNEGTTTGVGYNTIVAQKIGQVYGNCSEAGKEYLGDHE